MLNSWLDRLLVLLVITTAVLTLFALHYAGPSLRGGVQSAPPPSSAAVPAPASAPDFGFAQAGNNALQAGDAAAAIRWFERATQASQANAEWHRRLADAYRLNGDSLRASEEGLIAFELETQSEVREAP